MVESNPSNINNSICSCIDCKNKAATYLHIVLDVRSGYYCSQCATDLKWHGIAQEEVGDDAR